MSRSAEVFAEMIAAGEEQRRRLAAARPASAARPPVERPASGTGQEAVSQRWSPGAERFREDPFREHETLQRLLSFIQPDDVVLDVGGGAGRYLPIAMHCREFVNVEPAAGMGAQFEAAVREAKITNARWQQNDWFDAEIEGDVCFCANVIHYVPNIAPFIEHLDRAARRRVMVVMHSTPPTNVGRELFRLVNDEELLLAPGLRELLPVIWDLGLLPDVHTLGPSDFIAERARFATREAAIDSVVPAGREEVRDRIEAYFDEIFVPAEGGFMRKPVGTAAGVSRVTLVTWETKK